MESKLCFFEYAFGDELRRLSRWFTALVSTYVAIMFYAFMWPSFSPNVAVYMVFFYLKM